MKKYQTIFKINKENKIVIKLTSPANKLDYGDWAHVILKTKNQSYRILNYDTALECFRDLCYKLRGIIRNKVILDRSIKEDLGLFWNKIHNCKISKEPFELVNGKPYWLGLYHLMWSNPDKNSTWLFKNNKKIYLEVSPDYPWTSLNPKPKDKFYTFDKFVKDYKPLVILEIEAKVAQKWYKKVGKILADMKYNDDTLREAYYKNLQPQNS